MKPYQFLVPLIFFVITYTNTVSARETIHKFAIKSALATTTADEKLNQGVKFYFGNKHPRVQRTLVQVTTNKKTNAVGKSDKTACEHVFLSALIALQNRAISEGGNAVTNIRSYYKKNRIDADNKQYECGAGAIMAGVALTGKVVRLP